MADCEYTVLLLTHKPQLVSEVLGTKAKVASLYLQTLAKRGVDLCRGVLTEKYIQGAVEDADYVFVATSPDKRTLYGFEAIKVEPGYLEIPAICTETPAPRSAWGPTS